MTRAEGLLAYFRKQLEIQREKRDLATLQCDHDTASMWVRHYENLIEQFGVKA